jgi:hypothetical protein
MKEKEGDVLDLLIKHELAIEQLYKVFSARFPARRDFWQRLAGEEQRHADCLGTLRSESTSTSGLLYDSRLRLQAIKSSIGYVESQTVGAQEGRFSLVQALSIARDLENALLEKHFSSVRAMVSDEVGSILMDLAVETERHRNEITEALNIGKR